ncbi:MAG: CRISPR-associated endoribonuclease Cas6, partial [Thermoplasmata archaeon]
MMITTEFKPSESSENPSLPLDYRTGFMSLIKGAIEEFSPLNYKLLFDLRTVKPYTFAVLFGKNIKIKDERIYFDGSAQFKFRTVDCEMVAWLYNSLMRNRKRNIFGVEFIVQNVRVFPNPEPIRENQVIFTTVSPIMVRSPTNEKYCLVPKCENFKGDDGFDEALSFNIRELTRNL